ncbi:MAG: response regulator transcription factor [Nocardioides sp.]
MVAVLLVEDDSSIRTALSRGLRDAGHVVTSVATGGEAIASISEHHPDVTVLDLGLPDIDGSSVLALIRVLNAGPVIISTARDDEREIIRILDAGADDYLVKPFSAAQMDARIRAVLRRSQARDQGDQVLTAGGLRLDPTGRSVEVDGRPVDLSRKEFDLLHLLIQHRGEVITKQRLLTEVWQMPWGGADRTVDVHLSWLRRKLGESAAEPRFLISVRGVGVKLVDPGAAR